MTTSEVRLKTAIEGFSAGRLGEAEAECHAALAADRSCTAAFRLLGAIACRRGDFRAAADWARREVAAVPGSKEAHNNLGMSLLELGGLDEAEVSFRQALSLNPDYVAAHYNLGNALRSNGRWNEAAESYRRAVELSPDFYSAHVSLAGVALLTGDFERGWEEYEWRRLAEGVPNHGFSEPVWTGEPLNGRTLLLYAEQGLGDTLQFIRYVPLVRSLGEQVVVVCHRGLKSILSSCPNVGLLLAEGEALPRFDVHLPLLSLPRVLGTTPETIPAEVPYVFAEPGLVEEWRVRLQDAVGTAHPTFRVGFNWSGGRSQGPFQRRDIPLERFARLAIVPGVRLISLQRGEGREELLNAQSAVRQEAYSTIVDLGDDVDTLSGAFMDTAAILKNLDLVITSDTAVAHLAGALGVPVWVALPFVPDWRWLLDRGDSPWYPTMRLFRQKSAGDWPGVFQEVEAALHKLVVGKNNESG